MLIFNVCKCVCVCMCVMGLCVCICGVSCKYFFVECVYVRM